MPSEYKGSQQKWGGYTKSKPREWTSKEIEWVKDLKAKGYSVDEIAQSIDRTSASVQIKLKRLGKQNGNYNKGHIKDKYKTNLEFFEIIKPRTVLDLYCGDKNFYKQFENVKVVSNDKDKNIQADYHNDALKTICELYPKKFDLIDLDPYGSAYDCFDLAIKMATKGLIITLGELGHKRFKRLDYVSRYYGIESLDDFTIEKLIAEIQKIGVRNKKQLTPIFTKEWQNIGRVYFEIQDLKINAWKKKCDCCDKEIAEGYNIDDKEFYCSDDCLHSTYSEIEYDELCQQGKASWEKFGMVLGEEK